MLEEAQEASGGRVSNLDSLQDIYQALAYHCVPENLREHIMGSFPEISSSDPAYCLSKALEATFEFGDLYLETMPVLLVGPPGVGKSASIAKIAAQAAIKKQKVKVLTVDNVKAGAVEQLRTFTKAMGLDLHVIDSIPQLEQAVKAREQKEILLIDTPGANAFDVAEMETIRELAELVGARPILVLPAGGEPLDAAEVAREFAKIGADRMIVSRVDLARRYGNILTACAILKPTHFAASPKIAHELRTLDARTLAGLLLDSWSCSETDQWQTFLELVA